MLQKTWDRLKSPKLWTVLGGVAGIAGLLASSYQFYAASALNYRAYKGQLVLEAHRFAYEFIAEFTQHYDPPKAADEIRKILKSPNGPRIHPNIRTALIRADGAVARAIIIDDEDIRLCLQRIYQIQATLIESTMRQSKDVSLQEYALDLDGFPKMVGRYVEGKPLLPSQKSKTSDGGEKACSIIRDISELGF